MRLCENCPEKEKRGSRRAGSPRRHTWGVRAAATGDGGPPGVFLWALGSPPERRVYRPPARCAPVKAAVSLGCLPGCRCLPPCCVTGREPPDLGATGQPCRVVVMLLCQAWGKTARRGSSMVGRKDPTPQCLRGGQHGDPHWAECRFQEGWPGVLGLQLRCDLTLYPYPDLCHSSIKQPARPGGVPVSSEVGV